MENRRKIKYLDKNIQGYLMVLLIILEVMMVIIAMVYLYFSFNSIFEDNIYQIHKATDDSIYQRFLIEMVWVVVTMSIVNFIALFGANYLWTKYISRIINYLRETMAKVKKLSLQFPSNKDVPLHDLTIQIDNWQKHELNRAKQIHFAIEKLPKKTQEINEQTLPMIIIELQQQLRFAQSSKKQ